MSGEINMDNILRLPLGEVSGDIKVTFRKTIQKNPYEPEVLEIESKLNVDKELSGEDRLLLITLLAAQVEYAALINLAFKGSITEKDLEGRRESLEDNVRAIKSKIESAPGGGQVRSISKSEWNKTLNTIDEVR